VLFGQSHFALLQLESLCRQELASRLTLNCVDNTVQAQKLTGLKITIIDVFDEYALSNQVSENLCKSYPLAKRAHLKSGGNFPYLSRSDEVNLHLQVLICSDIVSQKFQLFYVADSSQVF
jgi:maspardin